MATANSPSPSDPGGDPGSAPGESRLPRYLGEAVRPRAGESYDWHDHDFGQLVYAAFGSIYVGTPGRVLLLSPAMLLWIPPGAKHWMRYGANNELHYVDVSQEESAMIGADCRIMAMTPLLSALISGTMPDKEAGRASDHNEALHDLLRHELVAAPDVPLSLAMPRDHRIRRFAEAALPPAARPSNGCSSPKRACRRPVGCGTRACYTPSRGWLPARRSARSPSTWAMRRRARSATCFAARSGAVRATSVPDPT